VAWSHDRKVATVDGGDLSDAQAFRRRHDGRIDCAERQVPVSRNEFGDAQPVGRVNWLDLECPVGQIAEESNFGLGPETGREQVHDLGDDKGRDDERAGMGLEQLERSRMVGVIGIDVGVERSGVDDERSYWATSAARISSMRSETSLRPLCPLPAAPRRRRVAGSPR
jgi:hypothetical protein